MSVNLDHPTRYNRTQTTVTYVYNLMINRVHNGSLFSDALLDVLSKVDEQAYVSYLNGADRVFDMDSAAEWLTNYYADAKNWR